MTLRVVAAEEAMAREAAAIASGIPPRALQQRAGAAAATVITTRFRDDLARGAVVFAGKGNNGGDAWVVAGALAAVGVRVRVVEPAPPMEASARAERELALPFVELGESGQAAGVVVDGLLGTGASGAPRGGIVDAIAQIGALRSASATIVSLDVPSGVDSTSGAAAGAVVADLTVSFGTVKRGLLVARANAGEICVVDIGLGPHNDLNDGAPRLVEEAWVRRHVPPIAAGSHKGDRRRLVIVGGGEGMAGAVSLAAFGAMRSGIGLVQLLVDAQNVQTVQTTVFRAIAHPWPDSEEAFRTSLTGSPDAFVVGPGLGVSPRTRSLVETVLRAWRGPIVLDADALNLFAGEAAALGALLAGRPAIVTPHVKEFARLAACAPRDVIERRFEIGRDLARTLNAVVLLKGVPTVITHPDGNRFVSAAGSPALGTGGSGDVLAGIAGTLLAQSGDALASAACAAWIHGHAAEIASARRAVRGVSLEDVIGALGEAWVPRRPRPAYPILATLAAVGDR
ncbi:MAG: hypothetical protein NVS4B3_14120 [Gemmatimonadaceae bacterium]